MTERTEGRAQGRSALSTAMVQKSQWMFRAAMVASWVAFGMNLAGCGPKTKIANEWSDPNVRPAPFSKVVVIAMSNDHVLRRIAEDEFVSRLPKGTEGVAGYKLISADDRENVDKVKAILEEAEVDGATVFRLVGDDTELQYNRGTVYYNFWGYYGWAWPVVYDPGYMLSKRVVRVESLVYSVENATLVWSGLSKTTDPKSAYKTIDDVVRLVIRRMERMGFVK